MGPAVWVAGQGWVPSQAWFAWDLLWLPLMTGANHSPTTRPHFTAAHLQVEFFDEDFRALLNHLNEREGVPKVPVTAARVWNANQLGPCQEAATAARAAGGAVPGAVPNPCNRSMLFEGPRAHCAAGLSAFFAEDIRLLFSPPVS